MGPEYQINQQKLKATWEEIENKMEMYTRFEKKKENDCVTRRKWEHNEYKTRRSVEKIKKLYMVELKIYKPIDTKEGDSSKLLLRNTEIEHTTTVNKLVVFFRIAEDGVKIWFSHINHQKGNFISN